MGCRWSEVQILSPRPTKPALIQYLRGTIIAYDPDIPSGAQRVRIEIRAGSQALGLWLDGVPLAMSDEMAMWQPLGGHHKLALVDARGNEVDHVEFEVRGTGARM